MSGPRLQFGDFELDLGQRELLENGRPLRLGGRALDILITLTGRPGETVTKDELIARVWPNTFVEEANLRVHMSALRKALGDGQAGRRYVSNIAGRGYAFVAAVKPVQTEAAAVAMPQPRLQEAWRRLPAARSRVVGRDETIDLLTAHIVEHGFLSVIGPGGIGKTTVAIAAADRLAARYEDGVRFIDLAPVSDAALVAGTVAISLGLSVTNETATDAIVEHLRTRQMLIVLDNCEHVVEAAAHLAEAIFRNARDVHLLVTSREALRVDGEHVHRLTPLDLPPPQGLRTVVEVMRFPAVQLFTERATANADTFRLCDEEVPTVVDLCRRLDGIPLAIEFAAARVDQFGLHGLAQRLDDRFQVLTKGRRTALPRHQTLRATLDWSYQTLSPQEQAVLRRLSVFAGNFSLHAAGIVAADTVLNQTAVNQSEVHECVAALAMKSLVSVDVGAGAGEDHYRLLETTRIYAFSKLKESGEVAAVMRNHAVYFCNICETATAEWETRATAEWTAAYGNAIDDIRLALDWALSADGDNEISMALAALSAPLWYQLSLQDEFRGLAERALAGKGNATGNATGSATGSPVHEIQLQIALGHSYLNTNGLDEAMPRAFSQALALARQHRLPAYEKRALWGLWGHHNVVCEYDKAEDYVRQYARLCEGSQDPAARVILHRMIMRTRHLLGDHAVALDYAERVLSDPTTLDVRAQNAGFQVNQRISAEVVLARILWLQGYPDQAIAMAQGIVDHATASGHLLSLFYGVTSGAGPIALFAGRTDLVAAWAALVRAHTQRSDYVYWQNWVDCFDTALDILNGTATVWREIDFGPQQREVLAIMDATFASDAMLAQAEAGGRSWCAPEFLRLRGELILWRDGDAGLAAAEQMFARAADLARQQGALAWELRVAMSMAQLRLRQGSPAEARAALAPVHGRFSEGFGTADLRQAEALLKTL